MSKKIIKLAAVSIIGAGIIVGAGSGIAYQVKWSQFKKDFDKEMTKGSKDGFPYSLLGFKLDSTSGHTVTYKMSTLYVTETFSEHYSAFKKFDASDLKFSLSN